MMWSLFKLVNQIPHQPISQVPDFDSGTFLEHVMMHRLAHCLYIQPYLQISFGALRTWVYSDKVRK